MKTVDEYLALVPQQHRDKPRFMATLVAGLAPIVRMQNVLLEMIQAFDLDSAIGVQLDIIGQWVGIGRTVGIPITGLYFTYDGTDAEGWDNSIWKSPNDPDSGFTSLPDDLYKALIRAKIMANKSCGCIGDIYNIINTTLSVDNAVKIVDNQNMTMTVKIDESEIPSVEKALIIAGYLPIQPAGVTINYENI